LFELKKMTAANSDVIIIGGGITGAGIARDLALRGLRWTLIEAADFASGATGACQGLLHSGARYAVSDPVAAQECIRENMILRRIASHCVEKTGGLFVSLPEDPLEYQNTLLDACRKVSIPAHILSPKEALLMEPSLSKEVIGAVKVPDASVNPFHLVMDNISAALSSDGTVMFHTRVVGIITGEGRVKGVRVVDTRRNEISEVFAEMTINACGAWTNDLLAMVDLNLPIVYSKGTIVVAHTRLVETVVNRCRPPADGDIIVPNETTTLIGTTSEEVNHPSGLRVEPDEVNFLLKEGTKIVPSVSSARLLRGYAGVRPLVNNSGARDAREISRDFVVIDHQDRGGLEGLISVLGGKLITYRLMAEKTVDLVCSKLGSSAKCMTHVTPLPASAQLQTGDLVGRLERVTAKKKFERKRQVICECELVTREDIERALKEVRTPCLDFVRNRTRMGMGSCQGMYCGYRTLAIMAEMGLTEDAFPNRTLKEFLEHRWRGVRPVIRDDQLRQEQLTEKIYEEFFNLSHVDA